MYIDELNRKAKIGKISIDIKDNRAIRIRYTYPKGKRNKLYAGTVTDENWREAIKTATIIYGDISTNNYDFTLTRYKLKQAQVIEVVEKIPNLLQIWENYRSVSQERVAATTIEKHWRTYEKHYLGRTPEQLLETNRADEYVAHLLTRYSPGSIIPIFSNCLNPSVNLAVKTNKIEENIYQNIPLQKKSRRSIEAYEPEEVKAVVGAFYSDEYMKKGSIYPHSFYAPMVDFLSIVGCRPSECHALTWNDIKHQKDKLYIKFNKAYSNGILLPHTKTYEIRLFPVNRQLKNLLESMSVKPNAKNLIFPSVTGGYVNQKTFGRRYWKTITTGLIADGKLDKHLRCYSLRHSFITRCIRQGLDIATVARISGNSTETITKYYLAAKTEFDVPEF